MAEDWREEAKGIVAWSGSLAIHESGTVRVIDVQADGRIVVVLHFRGSFGVGVVRPGEDGAVPDLSDPDTCAAFDCRLALRLGAPEEAAREGVIFSPREDGTGWRMLAGLAVTWDWFCGRDALNTNDPLLARVRAWHSVKPCPRCGVPHANAGSATVPCPHCNERFPKPMETKP